MTNPKEVAQRLMGLKKVCKECVFWSNEGQPQHWKDLGKCQIWQTTRKGSQTEKIMTGHFTYSRQHCHNFTPKAPGKENPDG